MTNRLSRCGQVAMLAALGLLPGAAAVADAPTMATMAGAQILSTISWGQTSFKTKQAASNAFVVGSARDAGLLADTLVAMDRPMKIRLNGTGKGCRVRFSVFDGTAPMGDWKNMPTAVWETNAPSLPYTFEATPKIFFSDDPNSHFGIITRKIHVTPVTTKEHLCMGLATELTTTFAAAGNYESAITSVKTPSMQLHQTWPGPTTQGGAFHVAIEGAGPVTGNVQVSLSGANLPAHTATMALKPETPSGPWPAAVEGAALGVFPGLKNLPAGTHRLMLTVKGEGAVRGTITAAIKVLVAQAPPAKGATISQIVEDGPGFFVGDKEAMTVTGTPGDLGTCHAYTLRITPITGGSGPQSLTFKNKTFPEKLTSGADFTALGDGVWHAAVTPSGALCTGSPDDALVQVDTPTGTFVKERPTVTMAKSDFVSERAKLTIAMPPSYAALNAAGTTVNCCDTELYFKNKSGAWAKSGGTSNRNFSDWDSDDASSFSGVIPYEHFMKTQGATEWALRVRATAIGQSFAWSNFSRFTVK